MPPGGANGAKAAAGPILGTFAAGSLVSGLWFGGRAWRIPLHTRFRRALLVFAAGLTPVLFMPGNLTMALGLFGAGLAVSPTLITGYALVERLVPAHLLTEGMAWVSTAVGFGAAIAVVDKDGHRAAVGCVHLDLSAGARLWHVAEIAGHMARVRDRFGVPDVLAGDVNEEPGRAAWRYLTRRYTDCYAAAPDGDGGTFPARRPGKRIDGVFAGPGLAVRSCGVPRADPADLAAATDHLPVQAELLFHHDLGEECRESDTHPRTICS